MKPLNPLMKTLLEKEYDKKALVEMARVEFKSLPFLYPTPGSPIGDLARANGRRVLKVEVTDADSRQRLMQFFTPCTNEERKTLFDSLLGTLRWPRGVFDGISAYIKRGDPRNPTDWPALLNKQTLGGRPSGKVSKRTKEKYDDIATEFYKSGISVTEFCHRMGYSRSTVYRSLRSTKGIAQKVSHKGV